MGQQALAKARTAVALGSHDSLPLAEVNVLSFSPVGFLREPITTGSIASFARELKQTEDSPPKWAGESLLAQ